MGAPQLVLRDMAQLVVKQRFWTNPLLIPAYLAAVLLVSHVLAFIWRSEPVCAIFGFPGRGTSATPTPPTRATQAQSQGLFDHATRHIQSQGFAVSILKFLRLLGTLTLVGLTTTALLVLENHDRASVTGIDPSGKWGDGHGSRRRRQSNDVTFTRNGWIEVIHLTLYSYTSLLALIALVSKRRLSFLAGTHLTLVMLAVVVVYSYRDLYPLATYTLVPEDGAQGWLLWSRIGVASLVAVFIPLLTPRIYTPVDPRNPAKDVNPELTASLWSLLTFSFMDPVIWLAARTPHLAYEALPPLADYDRAEYLVEKSEQVIDPHLRGKRTHLFWGLLRFFVWEIFQLIVMILIKCLSGLMAPFALNRLLTYLEGGEDAVIRPWVWVLWLFLGPNIGSVGIQYYIFLNTRLLVRTEGILTQLVFDHALRIRISEDPVSGSSPTPVASTPEAPSIVEGESNGVGEVERGSSPSGEETLRDSRGISTALSAKTLGKGKGKAVNTPSSIPATVAPGPDGAKPRTDVKMANLIGKINNLVTTDLGNITDGRDLLLVVLLGPLQIIICVCFLYVILDWSALIGMSIMVISGPLPSYVAKILNNVQAQRMKETDARVQTTSEILSVMRMVKLFGWESKVNARIAGKRETELGLLKKRQLLNLLNSNMNFFFPLLTMLVTFATYTTIQKEDLTVAKVFSSILVFDMLRDVLHVTFFMLPMMINAKVSLGRINDFLLNTELLDRFTRSDNDKMPKVEPSQNIDSKVIGFRDATFTWGGILDEREDIPTKRQFRLKLEGELFFQPGCLNLVIGPTGSGKTSLLMALLGEMHFEPNSATAGFNLPRDGGVAYAAQEAWVQSETIKENILFGKPYDPGRYDKVIFQCGLEPDLSLFEDGDATEVGEKGLTLSGGQKIRVTLARAVYSDANILLLDDILAALDVHTARLIVARCLQGDLLRDRTTILVTHNAAMVTPIARFVVSLGLGGRILSQGTVPNTLAKDHMLLQEVAEMNGITENIEKSIGSPELEKQGKNPRTKLVMAEEIALGHVGWPALKLYFSSLGGFFFWAAFLGGILFSEAASSLATWFLGYWATQYDGRPGWAVPVAYYLSVYTLILSFTMASYTVAMTVFVFGSIEASRSIHRKLIQSILGTTLRWLDTIPTARVIARCTQDIRAVDGPVSQYLSNMVELTMSLVIKLTAVILLVPFFILPGIVVFVVGGICGQLYINAQLSVKREMSNCRSPVLAHFGAAVSGLTSIRAYGAEAAFKAESLKRIDAYTRPARIFYNCNRWICIRIDAIGGIFSAGLAAYLVYGSRQRTVSNIGFSLTMAIGFSGIILWWIRVLNQFEVQGNSLERIQDYVNIEQEPEATQTGKPPAYWPASGALTVENLRARYSTDGPEVLHNISFEIESGERVGVVGRTGSGKSSLTLSLLRCIPTEGRVTFDGLPTDSINLKELRSSISLIPQRPELLSGTLRENLDPLSEHSDGTLNDALRAAGLFNLQGENDSSKITLDSLVSTGGSNLSIGQRQILALARAIVRGSKLLILDEATSAIDYATDTIIQSTLREVLKDATLITVAHRLQTIMDADKIMVLDAGKMVEFDSPKNLLLKREGYLKSLVDESGDRDALYRMVRPATGSAARS